jgi:hypothetical protein
LRFGGLLCATLRDADLVNRGSFPPAEPFSQEIFRKADSASNAF